jgi:hypothetical protein
MNSRAATAALVMPGEGHTGIRIRGRVAKNLSHEVGEDAVKRRVRVSLRQMANLRCVGGRPSPAMTQEKDVAAISVILTHMGRRPGIHDQAARTMTNRGCRPEPALGRLARGLA